MIDAVAIRTRYDAVSPNLDEKGLRLFAASEALAAGRGGIAVVSKVTGIARSTIGRGLKELTAQEKAPPQNRVRRTGGGRKAAVAKQPGLVDALATIIQSAIRGDPEAALLWVSKSQRNLAAILAEQGYKISHKIVGRLLKDMGFSLQANAKIREGGSHPDRNAQFEKINALVNEFQTAGQPAISVDTKKKENVGDFKNNGRTLRPNASMNRSGFTISSSKVKARLHPMAFLTSPPTKAGSTLAWIMTLPHSRSKVSAGGGISLAKNAMLTKPNVS